MSAEMKEVAWKNERLRHSDAARKGIIIKSGGLHGWKKTMPADDRRGILKGIVQKEGYATAVRRLNALRNISKDKRTDDIALKDMNYLRKEFR